MPAEWAGHGGADDPAHPRGLRARRGGSGGERFSEADRLHLLAEANKAAYWVRDNFICDPEQVPVDVAGFLSEARAEATRRAIRLDRALPGPHWAEIEHKDTVYLCVVDRDGNACSFINSLFSSFGSAHRCARMRGDPAQSRHRLPHHPRSSQRDRPAQAAVAHDHPRHAGQGRPRGDAVRGDGRALPGDGPRPFPASRARSRHGPAAGR